MRPRASWLVASITVLATIVYSVVVHALSVSDDRSDGSYLIALGSAYALAIAAGTASRHRLPIILLATIGVAVGWWVHRDAAWDPRWVYLTQHAGVFGALAGVFGISLIPGATPLITRLADLVHGPLDDAMRRYTRRVTWAWLLLCGGLSLMSLALFFRGFTWWWSVLVNFLTYPLVAALFVGEYLFRRHHLPNHQHASLMAGMHSFRRIARSEDTGSRPR